MKNHQGEESLEKLAPPVSKLGLENTPTNLSTPKDFRCTQTRLVYPPPSSFLK